MGAADANGGAPISPEDSILLGGDIDAAPLTAEREPEREIPQETDSSVRAEHASTEAVEREPVARYGTEPVEAEPTRHKEVQAIEPSAPSAEPAPAPAKATEEDPNRPKRGGWWQRRNFF